MFSTSATICVLFTAKSEGVVIPVDLTGSEKAADSATTALLDSGLPSSTKRYGTSEWKQFWIVLQRTLLFSRRDWVSCTLATVLFFVTCKNLSLLITKQ